MNENVIMELPRPFHQDMTPYKELKFSEKVKSASNSHGFSCLKIGKVIILGDVGVGKTSLVHRFCRNIFNYDYKSTIGVDFEIERFNILKIPFNLQLWDTAGQERFRSIAGAYYRNAHAIVVAFDLSSLRSLQNCLIWIKEALNYNNERPLTFLVGTKRDLLLDLMYNNVEKQAGEIARIIGAEYWSVSSKTGSQVSELFFRIAALCFEKLINLDADMNQTYPYKLGLIERDGKEVLKYRKNDIKCENGLKTC